MKTIGLFLGTTEDNYGRDAVRGVLKGLQGSRSRLVCYTSGTLHSRHGFEAQRNVLYDLVDGQTVDALIIAGSLSHSVGDVELSAFCQRYRPIPVVTMSVALPGIPAVVADNKAGFQQLMDHLLVDHGYTRLAFVSGPPGQQEAETRKAVFLEKMAQAGLSVPQNWIVHGDFTRFSGMEAANILCESLEHHPESPRFQVIVAANDSMALGLHERLADKGWRFPEDCAITGFDDLPESRVHQPPLTTVYQSVIELAAESARLALQILDGVLVPEITKIAPRLVVRCSCACFPNSNEHASREELLTSLANAEAELLQESRERAVTADLMDRLRASTENMLTSDSFSRLLGILNQNLIHMGFSGFWLSLFEDPGNPAQASRLHLASAPGGTHYISDQGIAFPSRQLIPGGLAKLEERIDLLVVEALYSRNFRMGFIVFATDPSGSQITGTLRSQISGALQAVLLLEERKNAEQHLIMSEKMAALGSLVAGVAHEINTPLGVAITAASFMSGQAERFSRKFKTASISKSELESLLADISQGGSSVEANLRRAADLVASFKLVASDQTSEQRRSFALKEYLQETLVSLHFQWRRRSVEVKLEGPDNLMMDSYPGTIAQIITNLIANSLMHAFPAEAGGHIQIGIEAKKDRLLLWFSDDGVGIPAEFQKKVFDPFFTTKRGQGGTGLGLHIIFNLVTQILGGTIKCASQPGQGTRFDLLLPRVSPNKKNT